VTRARLPAKATDPLSGAKRYFSTSGSSAESLAMSWAVEIDAMVKIFRQQGAMILDGVRRQRGR